MLRDSKGRMFFGSQSLQAKVSSLIIPKYPQKSLNIP